MNIIVPNPTTEREAGEIETVCSVLHGEFGGRKFMLDAQANVGVRGFDVVTPSVMTEWCVRHGLEWRVEAATLWDVRLVRMRRAKLEDGNVVRMERPTW